MSKNLIPQIPKIPHACELSPQAEGPTRPWLFVGTIPEAAYPLHFSAYSAPEWGPQGTKESLLLMGAQACAVNRGSPAMLAAAALTCAHYARQPSQIPQKAQAALYALVAGDIGNGQGSRKVYQTLLDVLPGLQPLGITFHYLLPDVDWHNRILLALEALPVRPLLVADAGYMYAAKMSGYAGHYDLFTPDLGELAFLADEKAPHPFYTRNFLLADETQAESLISKAYAHHNAARHMLVKGKIDRHVYQGHILESMDSPDVPMLEPVGGTGDTLTGIVSALLASHIPMAQACPAALRINRRMGLLAHPTPASSVADLLRALPAALQER